MSDDERDLDLDSDEDGSGTGSGFSSLPHGQDKRAHHNALERKRRDHIKDSFTGLKDAIPTLQGDKSSRAQILKKASEYIAFMRRKNGSHSNDIEDLKRQNNHLENQVVIHTGVGLFTLSLSRSRPLRRQRVRDTLLRQPPSCTARRWTRRRRGRRLRSQVGRVGGRRVGVYSQDRVFFLRGVNL
eukprot:TRINITY_DN11229_c0_g1_i1.p1 TRINITY_DN11229_c0_g1~~TRINITY_DN11229_c0_g1_i1.p1  ORF type:complete len:185 (-),score=49.49 TRINITY_DN11229_c0_g1_i1:157-711(-)